MSKRRNRSSTVTHWVVHLVAIACVGSLSRPVLADPPTPLLTPSRPVDWWFVFKLNASKFPRCGGVGDPRACPFGGKVQDYQFGQQFVYASSDHPELQQGHGCVGTQIGEQVTDPLGATVDRVYDGKAHYVVWNDQFYDDPRIAGCTKNCGAPWGHSKGMLSWDDSGDGVVLQVTTPSWPAAGSKAHPRSTDGNTLGCVEDDNVKVSQHFFALRLTKSDVVLVLDALKNASVVTDASDAQIVSNGGPDDIQHAVLALGRRSDSTSLTDNTLSTGVRLISKPSDLNVPPWQLVSAKLGGAALRTATWWTTPFIPTTVASTTIKCWSDELTKPGAVQIATSGQWDGTVFNLKGGPAADNNHAKIGVTVGDGDAYAIFGDLNQQGTLSDSNCARSQNGRGGLFFIVKNAELAKGVTALVKGSTAPKATR